MAIRHPFLPCKIAVEWSALPGAWHVSRFRAALLGFLAMLSFTPLNAAEPWNIPHEKVVILKGKVVDVLCVLKQDCPQSCGSGRRQLGILQADGKLRFVAKGLVDFSGAVPDLVPYCGKEVELDGLLVENPAVTLFFAQGIRTDASSSFAPTDAFLNAWTTANGKAEEWWRNDPTAKRVIDEDGVLGIKGLELKKK